MLVASAPPVIPPFHGVIFTGIILEGVGIKLSTWTRCGIASRLSASSPRFIWLSAAFMSACIVWPLGHFISPLGSLFASQSCNAHFFDERYSSMAKTAMP